MNNYVNPYIGEILIHKLRHKDIQNMVNNDPDVKDKMQVVFLTNFNVSYAEKIYAAANSNLRPVPDRGIWYFRLPAMNFIVPTSCPAQ